MIPYTFSRKVFSQTLEFLDNILTALLNKLFIVITNNPHVLMFAIIIIVARSKRSLVIISSTQCYVPEVTTWQTIHGQVTIVTELTNKGRSTYLSVRKLHGVVDK